MRFARDRETVRMGRPHPLPAPLQRAPAQPAARVSWSPPERRTSVELELRGLGARLRVAQRQLEPANAVLDRELPLLFLGDGRQVDDRLGVDVDLGVGPRIARRVEHFGSVARFVRGLQLALQRVALANRALPPVPAAA